MADEAKQNAPEFSGHVKATPHMDAILRDVQVNKERVKQARAEVLAACLADIDTAIAIYAEHSDRSKDEKLLVAGVCLGIRNRLQELQPAAEALEELLRKAHNEGHECENSVIKIDEDGRVQDCQYKVELLRKKARAIKEKG